MAYGRFRRDPCGTIPAPKRWCERCSRMFGSAEHERRMVHTCRACIERQAEMLEAAERLPSSDMPTSAQPRLVVES